MAVRKKGNKWYCRFQIDGVRYERTCKGATTEREAEKCEAVIKGKFMQGIYDFASSHISYMLFDGINYFLEYSELHKRSHKLDENYCKVIKEYFGNKPMKDIHPEDIEKFKKFLKDKREPKLSNATVNRYLEALSRIYNLAISNEQKTRIIYNPVARVAKLPKSPIMTRILKQDEEELIFKISKFPDLMDVIICALNFGMRIGEIFPLVWNDVNIKERELKVYRYKTDSYDFMYINNKALEMFNRRQKDPVNKVYVFTNPETNLPYTNMDKAFRRLKKLAGIKEHLRIHDLRHTFATRALENGADIVTVMELLGQSNVSTTRRYTNPSKEAKKRALTSLG